MSPHIRAGRTRLIQFMDLPALDAGLDPGSVPSMPSRLRSGKASEMFRVIMQLMQGQYRRLACQGLLNVGFGLAVSGFLYLSIRWFGGEHGSGSVGAGLALVAGFTFFSLCRAVNQQLYYYRALRLQIAMSSTLSTAIYRKSLRLGQQARSKRFIGDIVNHMSSDVDSLTQGLWIFVDLLLMLVLLAGVCSALFLLVGSAAFYGLAVLFIIGPLTTLLIKRVNRHESVIMGARDERLTLLSQILQGIRIIKYQALESKAFRDVAVHRQKEFIGRRKLLKSTAASAVLFAGMTTMVAGTTFVAMVLQGRALDPAVIFTTLSLFALLEEPLTHLAFQVVELIEGWVTAGRVASFLAEEETAVELAPEPLFTIQDAPACPKQASVQGTPGISLAGLTCVDGQGVRLLDDITLRIGAGESVAVLGPVGAGKSVLLQAILGEFPVAAGSIDFPPAGSRQASGVAAGQPAGGVTRPPMAYVPQQSFIMNATVGENVAFGSDAGMEIEAALERAAFLHDLRLLPAGIETEIGEHGVNLSGGQKQRLSLARAAASGLGVYLLDDPVAAVDDRTEDHIFDHLVFGLLDGRTRLVVTHRVRNLSRFDKVVYLEDGKIRFAGTPEAFADTRFPKSAGRLSAPSEAGHVAPAPAAAGLPSSERFTDDEERETGKVKWSAYAAYLRLLHPGSVAGRHALIAGLLGLAVAVVLIPLLQRAWLGLWSDGGGNRSSAPFAKMGVSPLPDDFGNLCIYLAMGAAGMLIAVAHSYSWRFTGIKAGQHMHDQALNGVLRSPLRFFDATPIGRILNRFSRDQLQVDSRLVWMVSDTFYSVFVVIATLIAILLFVPSLALVLVPTALVFFSLQSSYRRCSREVQRIRSIKSSPRFAHFKETLSGIADIRAYGRQEFFLQSFLEKQRDYQKCFHFEVRLNRWFSIRLPLVSAVVALFVGGALVLMHAGGRMSPGMAAMLLGYAVGFWESLNWAVRAFAMMENQMVSVERLSHYVNLPSEEPLPSAVAGLTSAAPHVPAGWPAAGAVSFENVSMRYADHLPEVLKGLSFNLPAGSKVGICGRTGAGKSSVITALFRFCELSAGRIAVDGVDIRDLPRDRLRRSLAIIPQDPFFFRGTLRQNLDLAGEHADGEVWETLRVIHMDGFVERLKGGLHAEVMENGNNFSQGQRQLFCLARAILRRSKIIILDEATASVDIETDRRISETVRSVFSDTTMLIIAHRRDTIEDCDYLMELSDGKAISFRHQARSNGVSTQEAVALLPRPGQLNPAGSLGI